MHSVIKSVPTKHIYDHYNFVPIAHKLFHQSPCLWKCYVPKTELGNKHFYWPCGRFTFTRYPIIDSWHIGSFAFQFQTNKLWYADWLTGELMVIFFCNVHRCNGLQLLQNMWRKINHWFNKPNLRTLQFSSLSDKSGWWILLALALKMWIRGPIHG